MNKLIMATLALACSFGIAGTAMAQSNSAPKERPAVSVDVPARLGLGQATPDSPAMLSRLGLSDPLVQQKYINEPDMLRFLRGTYAEACTRGYMASTLSQIKSDDKNEMTPAARLASENLISSKRVWKLTSFEMERIFGKAYLTAANHCDCLMQEVSDADLVNPRKGIEVIKDLPKSAQTTCERIALEKADKQFKISEKLYGKGVK